MKLLVTGLSGFVGSHCADIAPHAVDLAVDGRRADLRDAAQVQAAIDAIRPDAVLHLAGQSFVPTAIEEPQLTGQVNVEGTRHLLQALSASGFGGRMLYVGSADAYGVVPESKLPVTEAQPLAPLNPYAQSKADAENLCRDWAGRAAFEIVIARPFNHIGPRQGTRFAVSSFARQVAAYSAGRGSGKLVAGNLDTTRDFTDVRDVVAAYMALLHSGRNGEAYNVCSGVERSMRELVLAMMEAAGVEMEIVTDESLLRPTEQLRMWGSFDKLRADTGWSPAIPLRTTLKDTFDYWLQEDGR